LGSLPKVGFPTFFAGAAAAGAWALVARKRLGTVSVPVKFLASLGGELLLDYVKPSAYVTTPKRTWPIEPFGSPKK
jgi:hypothetical protein